MLVEQDHPVLGKIRMPNLPFRFSDCDSAPQCIAPAMGQHNLEIAESVGFSACEMDAMERDGVLHAQANSGAKG